jgi:hypothetical protein
MFFVRPLLNGATFRTIVMPAQDESPIESMKRALAACDGQRFPLDGGSSKVLRFMLERPDGCDALISRDAFEIRFGWHPSRHRYFLRLACAVVSELFQLSGHADGPTIRARIGPAAIPALQFPAWSFGERLLWLDRSPEAIAIHVRDGREDLNQVARALPEPISYELNFIDFPSPLACTKCGAATERYRRLSDGALLCAACCRSFVLGDVS